MMRKAKEKKPTNNNMTELNMDEMELANGGIDFDVRKAIGGAVLGGGVGAVGGACEKPLRTDFLKGFFCRRPAEVAERGTGERL